MAKVKVKIAVAVDRHGVWNSCGASSMDEDDMSSLASEVVEPGERRYWLEAELEVPEPTVADGVVQATVSPAAGRTEGQK